MSGFDVVVEISFKNLNQLLFALGITALVAAAVYLSKKRLNMAGLSIGVDFLQVCLLLHVTWY